MFCKKILWSFRPIFLISRFPGRTLMCSTRKSHWNEQKDVNKRRCSSDIFSFLASCLILASWQLQNRWFAEHLHWLLLRFFLLPELILFLMCFFKYFLQLFVFFLMFADFVGFYKRTSIRTTIRMLNSFSLFMNYVSNSKQNNKSSW